MWKALSELNYIGASYEMLDSRWAKQTPNRAKAMAKTMKEINMIYKGQKLSDNLTKSQRDMFKYMIDRGDSIEETNEE